MKSCADWYQRWRKVLEKFKHVTNPHISFAIFFFFSHRLCLLTNRLPFGIPCIFGYKISTKPSKRFLPCSILLHAHSIFKSKSSCLANGAYGEFYLSMFELWMCSYYLTHNTYTLDNNPFAARWQERIWNIHAWEMHACQHLVR